MADETAYEGWAILELMGHRRLAGYVQEVEIAGAGMLRLDIPSDRCAACKHEEDRHTSGGMCTGAHDGDECYCVALPPLETEPQATQFYSPAALYCLTPTTEDIARRIAVPPRPAQRWELEPPKPTPTPTVEIDMDAVMARADELAHDDRDDETEPW